MEKEQILSTLSTPEKRINMIFKTIQNNEKKVNLFWTLKPKRLTRIRINKLIGQLIIVLETVLVNRNQFKTI